MGKGNPKNLSELKSQLTNGLVRTLSEAWVRLMQSSKFALEARRVFMTLQIHPKQANRAVPELLLSIARTAGSEDLTQIS